MAQARRVAAQPVGDLFAPRPEPEPEPEPPAAREPEPAPAPETRPEPTPEPAPPAAGAPVVEMRRPVLFDHEAVERDEAPAPAARVTPVPPAPVERVERVEFVAPVEAAPVEVPPADEPAEAVERTRAQRNPLDDLFLDRDEVVARREPKPPKARRAKPEPKPKREPKPKPEPKAKAPRVEPPREGPWKPHSRRRKHKAGPPPPPWEGKFDTSRERELPFKPAAPLPAGTAPLAVCVRHTGAVTRKRCARCGQPACDECLVTTRGRRSTMCIECAIIEAGVRSRRRSGG
jgi:hypothetical protein